MKLADRVALTLLLAAWCSGIAPAAPIRAKMGPRITSIEASADAVKQYGTFEVSIDLDAEYANPFDNSAVQVTGQFQDPDGALHVVEGFYYQDYRRTQTADGTEKLALFGEPRWRVRFTPQKPGDYLYTVSVTTRDGRTFSGRRRFSCLASASCGFVRTICGRYLQCDSGRPFYPIGQNLAWSRGSHGTYDYDDWLAKLSKAGANFARIWLWRNGTFDLELMPDEDGNGGVGRYDLANAWRLDHVLRRCEELDIKVMLCFFDFHPLAEDFTWDGRKSHPWENCPYNALNGGPLGEPADFFSNDKALACQRQLIRYVVNRFGASTAIAAWELFNEVDLAPGYKTDSETIRTWHTNMADLLDVLDPYHRPVTTSCSEPDNRSRVWTLGGIDIAQSHSYNEKDMGEAVPRLVRTFEALKKPLIFGEIGADVDFSGEKLKDDPTGIHLHNAIWAGIAGGAAGSPLSWWWDTYIDAYDLYGTYTGPAKFAATIPWCAEDYKTIAVNVREAPEDVRKGVKLNAYVHGAMHRKDLGAGPTFEVDFANDGAFTVTVANVAAGAMLKVYLDNREVVSEDLPASKSRGSWRQLIWHKDYSFWEAVYDRAFTVSVAQGRHVISIRNDGADWLTLSGVALYNYAERGETVRMPAEIAWGKAEFSNYKVAPSGVLSGYRDVPLRPIALGGATTAVVWVQNRANTWFDRKGDKPEPEAARGVLSFPSIGPGSYMVQAWDTYSGRVLDEQYIEVDEGENLQITTPPISTDAAYRIEKGD